MLCPSHAHMTSRPVSVPSDFAFTRLSCGEFVGGWALGSMGLELIGPGVWRGRSLFDGSDAHVEILARAELGIIDYAVGSAEQRSPRIFIRVTPGDVLGLGSDCCLVTLHALRSAAADDARWARTCTAHETEILLIKAQLERAFAGSVE
jgi:hypothetical protein